MSARHRQAERRRRETKLLTEALLREAGSVVAAVIDAKLPARSGAVALRATAEPETVVERDQLAEFPRNWPRSRPEYEQLARKGTSRS
jgi:hypothetical protein